MKFIAPLAFLIVIAIVGNSIVSSATSTQTKFKSTIERRLDTSEIQ